MSRRGALARLALLLVLLLFLAAPRLFAPLLAPLAGGTRPAVYEASSLLQLAASHLLLAGAATGLAALVAVGLAILVTRRAGAEFLPLSRTLANIGQTFPPVAVLALAVPLLGFGAGPTLVALFLYALLPIFENALAGLSSVPPDVTEAARGSGMTPVERLRLVELPLAAPLILAGVRLSAIISLGTAAIGSTVAAKTLGEVVIAGLLSGNTAFVLQGGLVVAALAILLNDALLALERRLARRAGVTAPRRS